jgi:hypothetical protein
VSKPDENRRQYPGESFEHLWGRSVAKLSTVLGITPQEADAMLRRNQGPTSRVAEAPKPKRQYTKRKGKRVQTDDAELARAVQHARPLLPRTHEQAARMTAVGILRTSALWYASMGWPVFPLAPGGKVPITATGFKEATADLATIERWWDANPYANIGTPTGVLFDVIDVDAPDGFETWARIENEWRDQGYAVPKTIAQATTGNGGRHLLVPPQGVGNSVALGPGLDYRGRGGYIVLPPSQLASGGLYDWLQRP